jgi:hypothetical protein
MAENSELPRMSAAVPDAVERAVAIPQDRRTAVRYPFSAAAEVYDQRSETSVTGRCSDLGLGGCYIDTFSQFPAGSAVAVRIARDDHQFQAGAVVAYSHLQLGMGLTFTEISRNDQQVLRSWIAELSGEHLAEPEEPGSSAPEAAATTDDTGLRFVMSELITLLVRRKTISEAEGAELLKHMFR